MKLLLKTLLAVVALISLTNTALAEEFSDVQSGHSHYVAISYLKEKGIVQGYDDNTFKPNQKISRVEALKMIILSTNFAAEDEINNENVTENPFIDTPKSEWYAKYLAFASEKKLIGGYPDNTFKPNQTINLAETLKIFLQCFNGLEYPENMENFLAADTPTSEWYAPFAAYAYKNGLVNITDSNKIIPTQDMTRGYVAEIIYRKLRRGEGLEFGKATYYGKAVQGHYTASGEIFDTEKSTAAHQFLPFGTIVKATNLANGQSVDVKINDRGPYGYGRVLDLSSSAFDAIAWLGTGIINIQYQIVHLP